MAEDSATRSIRRIPKRIVVLPDGVEGRPRLTGLKMIAAYLKETPLQVHRIITAASKLDDPMPVFKLYPIKNGRWHVFIDDLDAWMDRRAQRIGGWGKPR